METHQSNKTSEKPLMHLVHNHDQLRNIDETSVQLQDARGQSQVANEEARAIIQGATEGMIHNLQKVLAAAGRKNFRIQVEEEINITERP
jgi:hypothetical protein